jgi:hypothetical protein
MSIKSEQKQGELIPVIAVIGVVFYILLMLVEAALYPQMLLGAVLGSVFLGLLATVFVWTNENAKHVVEMVLIWVMIFGFVAYGFLCFGGVI